MLDNTRLECQHALHDAELKKKLLRIYINAESLVDWAQYIDLWVTMKIRVVGVKGVKLTAVGGHTPCAGFLFCRVHFNDKVQALNMSPLPFQSTITWPPPSSDNPTPFYTHRHSAAQKHESTYKDRSISIDLYKGTPTTRHILLGTWAIDLIQLKRGLDQHLSTITTKDETADVDPAMTFNYNKVMFYPQDQYCSSGPDIALTLSVTRATPEEEEIFRLRRRKEHGRGVMMVLDWIEHFKADAGEEEWVLEPGYEVPLCGNLSLMHAAVYLEDV